ncbi:MAG: HK97 gp10 family phage protein [ANME-2 cluster archaeon]|nr:HK97 gp10 family phage protein [ANME-2 cluster archaeon]
MSKGTRLIGGKEVLKTLQKIGAATEKTIPDRIESAAFEIEREAALTVQVDTGRLKGSIQTVKQDDTNYEVSAGGMKIGGVEVDYATSIEFGTKHSRAYPFMRPAAAKARTKYPDTIISGVEDGIKQAGV